MVGWMACSKAGHDKNKIYIIIEETGDYVYLADGEIRKIENAKRKKKKHVQIIKKTMDEKITLGLTMWREHTAEGTQEINPAFINETIKRTIKLYKQSLMS